MIRKLSSGRIAIVGRRATLNERSEIAYIRPIKGRTEDIATISEGELAALFEKMLQHMPVRFFLTKTY